MKNLKEYSDEIFEFLKEAAPSAPIPPTPPAPATPNLPPIPPSVPSVDWAELSKEIQTFQKTLNRMGYASIDDFRQSVQINLPPTP